MILAAPITQPSVESDETTLRWWRHQRAWIEDRSAFRLCLKSRQIGMSTVVAAEAVRDAVAGKTTVLASASERQSRELMRRWRACPRAGWRGGEDAYGGNYGRIRIVHRDGLSVRAIARTYHHSRRKVRDALAEPEPQRYARTKDPPLPKSRAVHGDHRAVSVGRRPGPAQAAAHAAAGLSPPE